MDTDMSIPAQATIVVAAGVVRTVARPTLMMAPALWGAWTRTPWIGRLSWAISTSMVPLTSCKAKTLGAASFIPSGTGNIGCQTTWLLGPSTTVVPRLSSIVMGLSPALQVRASAAEPSGSALSSVAGAGPGSGAVVSQGPAVYFPGVTGSGTRHGCA